MFSVAMEDDSADSVNKDQEQISKSANEFVHLLKEKRAAEEELAAKERELNGVKGRNYELLKKVDALEKEVSDLKGGKQGNRLGAGTGSRPGSSRPTTPNVSPSSSRRKSMSRAKHPQNRQKPRTGNKPVSNGVTEAKKPADEKDTYSYYSEIAENFPNLRLSTLLLAEKKFVEADVDKSGTIDSEELEKILDKGDLMFTKQQVKDILKEIDSDNSGDLDFTECLTVIDKLTQNKRTNLPASIQQNKSSVCIVQ